MVQSLVLKLKELISGTKRINSHEDIRQMQGKKISEDMLKFVIVFNMRAARYVTIGFFFYIINVPQLIFQCFTPTRAGKTYQLIYPIASLLEFLQICLFFDIVKMIG